MSNVTERSCNLTVHHISGNNKKKYLNTNISDEIVFIILKTVIPTPYTALMYYL